MGHFHIRYDSRVVIYERKMFIRLATAVANLINNLRSKFTTYGVFSSQVRVRL